MPTATFPLLLLYLAILGVAAWLVEHSPGAPPDGPELAPTWFAAVSGPAPLEPRARRRRLTSATACGGMEPMLCEWCRRLELPATPGVRFCGQRCRQAAFRLRRRASLDVVNDRPMRFGYADPPYPGTARKYYRDQPTFAGEVDHGRLVASLVDAGYDGWALSTSAKALGDVLPLCPPGRRICSWVKPHPPSPRTFGPHNVWEPVIVVGGRRRRPGVADALVARPARGGGETLPGRKPIAFCAWLFNLLGMLPGDELVDLFPGTGIVGRAWAELSSKDPNDGPSPTAARDASPEVLDDGRRRTPAHDDGASSPGVGDAGGRQLSLACSGDGPPATAS